MKEFAIIIAVSLLLLTLVAFAIFAIIWRKKKKDSPSSVLEDEQLIELNKTPSPGTKIACVQPRCPATTKNKEVSHVKTEDSCGYLYFTIKYDSERSMLTVKLIKGENIPTHKSYPSKPYIEIGIIPLKPEPIHGKEGIEYEIFPEELFRQTVHFCICRYDKFSKKATIGDVFLSLAELKTEEVDLSDEIFLKNVIRPSIEVNLRQQQSAKDLWNKLRIAVHSGKLRQLKRRSFVETLTWNSESTDIGLHGVEKIESKPGRHESVKDEGPLGTLFFSLKYDSKRSVLLVRVMKAEDIPDHDGQIPNVMVECTMLPGKESEKPHTTAVQLETFKPMFEETFEYKVDFEDLWRKKLHLVVWYVDLFSIMSSLGEVVHSLGQLDIEGLNISEMAMLVSKEIMLLHHTRDSSMTSSDDSSSILFSLTYLPATNRLGVLILKARDIKTVQDNRGVYVEVTVLHGSSRFRKVTSFKLGTHNPLYNEALLFDLKGLLIRDVRLQTTVFQKVSVGSEIPLGRVMLGKDVGGSEESHWLETLTAEKATAQWHKLQPCPTVRHLLQGIPIVRTKELRSSFGVPRGRK